MELFEFYEKGKREKIAREVKKGEKVGFYSFFKREKVKNLLSYVTSSSYFLSILHQHIFFIAGYVTSIFVSNM